MNIVLGQCQNFVAFLIGPKFRGGWANNLLTWSRDIPSILHWQSFVTKDILINCSQWGFVMSSRKDWSTNYRKTPFVALPVIEIEDKFVRNIISGSQNTDIVTDEWQPLLVIHLFGRKCKLSRIGKFAFDVIGLKYGLMADGR